MAGSLPAGLGMGQSTGMISGTPTSATKATSLKVTVTDSSSPTQSQSATLSLSVYANVGVSTPNAAAVAGQVLTVSTITNDPAGVTWAATGPNCTGGCGTFSSTSSTNGQPITWTAPSTPGVYDLTATSAGDGTTSSSINVGVTNLAGVDTIHYDLYRDGVNSQEYALTPSLVTPSTFGKLFSCTVDGAIYAQPLWAPQLTIGGTKHNVVFVATQHDSLYAFDADTNTSPCTPLWKVSLIDAAHGGQPGETTVPSSGSGTLVGIGLGDIAPEVGVTGTPVIDPATNTLYVVSKSVSASQTNFYQRLHAIDITTGNEKFSGPATIAGTYPGTYAGGTLDPFESRTQLQRPGLALANGTIYITWASHEDNPPYSGWVMAYNAATLQQTGVLNITPNTGEGGIWMDGNAPPVDSSGNVYVSSGNGKFDGNSTTSPNNDYGDSVLQLNPATLGIEQTFTPSDQATDDADDIDMASGGTTLIDLPTNGANPTHLLLSGGKDGTVYILNRDKMGGYTSNNSTEWELLYLSSCVFFTPAYWNNTLFVGPSKQSIQSYALDPQTAQFSHTPSSETTTVYGFFGSTPVISTDPEGSNAILWSLDNTNYCTPRSPGCGPAILHAYLPGDLSTELWNSSMSSANTAGYAVKFTQPTVANGHVYIGTRGNNTGGADTSTSTPGELDVYGFLGATSGSSSSSANRSVAMK